MASILEDKKTLEGLLTQLYSPTTGKKLALSQKKYDAIYEQYEEIEKRYEADLDGEERPEYGMDELNDLLDDVCVGLA